MTLRSCYDQDGHKLEGTLATMQVKLEGTLATMQVKLEGTLVTSQVKLGRGTKDIVKTTVLYSKDESF